MTPDAIAIERPPRIAPRPENPEGRIIEPPPPPDPPLTPDPGAG